MPPTTETGLREYLAALFDGATGVMELRALPSKRTAFVPLAADRAVERFIRQCETDNVYIGVAARKDSTSGKLENCSTLGAVFADIDFKQTREAEARETLAAFPLPPTVIVHSGGGLHLYYALREPLDLATDEPRARSLLERLAVALRGDQSAAEPARVLRVPGTLNRKPEYGTPRPVTMELCQPDRRYNPSELEELRKFLPAPAGSTTNGRFHAPEEPLGPGERRPYLFRLARSLKVRGLTEAAVLAAALEENTVRCRPPVPDEEVEQQVRSAFAQADRPGFEPESDRSNGRRRAGWDAARSAPEFLNEPEPLADEIEPHQLARGSVTEWFSPRGLGKTMIAHALAVKHARGGLRVLLLDRDNSRREVKRRLRGWGADDAAGLMVMARDEVPPLTDRAAWARFPFRDYDVVIIDSIDASTEGVGEQDSAKPGRAIAAVLDVARRADGPAVLLLGNVIKSGAYGRGSGVVEDRADIVYEVRDATELRLSGSKPWWLELPAAGREAWGERAARRKRRETYRLAFIATKYRIGEEPNPFVLEVHLRECPWTYRDVTAELEAAGQAARAAKEAERQAARETAAAAVLAEVARRMTAGEPALGKKQAEVLLQAHGLTSRAARELLRRDTRWHLRPDPIDERKVIVGPWSRGEEAPAPASHDSESTRRERRLEESDAGTRHQSERPHSTGTNATPDADSENHEMRAPSSTIPPAKEPEVEL